MNRRLTQKPWSLRFAEVPTEAVARALNYWEFDGAVRCNSLRAFAFSVNSKLISSKSHGRKSWVSTPTSVLPRSPLAFLA